MPYQVSGIEPVGSRSDVAGKRRKTADAYGAHRCGDGGRCRDRTCDPTRVKGVLYR